MFRLDTGEVLGVFTYLVSFAFALEVARENVKTVRMLGPDVYVVTTISTRRRIPNTHWQAHDHKQYHNTDSHAGLPPAQFVQSVTMPYRHVTVWKQIVTLQA